jgi:hypothetical protein
LSVEGLHLTDEKASTLPRVQKKIQAIMDIAVAKNSAARDEATFSKGLLRRKLPVRER